MSGAVEFTRDNGETLQTSGAALVCPESPEELFSSRGLASTQAAESNLFRLYLLRAAYFVMAVGLGTLMWPNVIQHTNEFALAHGIKVALLAALGLRYPLKMLPSLLFELTWKAIYLIAFALPLWRVHQINPATAEDIKAVLMVVILIPLIPWRYVFVSYLLQHGDRWK